MSDPNFEEIESVQRRDTRESVETMAPESKRGRKTYPCHALPPTKNTGSLDCHTIDLEESPYSIFASPLRRLLVVILIFTMLASPLTATIYLPLLPLLARQFGASIQAINLTITVYIIFQAISPLLFATASDAFGRRPIYLITYALYTFASLGLALNKHNYAALLSLRALQSLGASAVLAVAFGVVADVWPPATRGSVLGITQGAANVAVCLGPIIGGWVALESGGFEWVFWALTIFGGTVLLVVGMALPETARNIVGNGSVEPNRFARPWWTLFHLEKHQDNSRSKVVGPGNDQYTCKDGLVTGQGRGQNSGVKSKLKKANPMAALRIIFWKDTALALWMAASPYAVWYCIQPSIPIIYTNIYHFNQLQVGLSYLTGGAGVVVAGYANGKLLNWNYKVTAQRIGHTVQTISGDDLTNFPIERARARGAWHFLVLYICALAGYGWPVVTHTHESVPLILQFILAALCTYFQQTFNTLLVDIFPASPSTAAASGNITRCALSAIAVATLQPLVDAMGRGWYFTLLAIISGGGGLAANGAIIKYGMLWRCQRLSKQSEQHRNCSTV